MTIEIEKPELEALIRQRMSTGQFATIEDALLQALQNSPEPKILAFEKASLGQILRESPLWGSGLEIERAKDFPGIVEF